MNTVIIAHSAAYQTMWTLSEGEEQIFDPLVSDGRKCQIDLLRRYDDIHVDGAPASLIV